MELKEIFEQFITAEKLEGKEMYECKKCKKKTVANKKVMISENPEILVLHLKRFKHNTFFGKKKSDVVNFPLLDFDISNYVHESKGNCVYDLFGLVNHSGSLDGKKFIFYFLFFILFLFLFIYFYFYFIFIFILFYFIFINYFIF